MLTEMAFSGMDFLQYVWEINEQELMISPLGTVLAPEIQKVMGV